MTTKHCKLCGEEKLLDYFYKAKTNKDGRDGTCKLCRNLKSKKWYSENKEYHKQLTSKYYEDNKEKILEYGRKWYSENKEHRLEVSRNWEINNKNKRINIAHRFRSNIRNRISNSFSRSIYNSLKGNKQNRSWESIVGYSLVELISHLESLFLEGMNWDNYGSDWSIDHIRPIISFNILDYNCSDFKECWKLKNLQPLWKTTNIRKSDKWDGTLENKSFNLNYITYETLLENLK